ncbi:FlaD/FlaE family flagellar protein [Natrialba sp. INN-245]|uniref:FlaD/FlaE family flagellar protein n=1 Tax=Natrialba sp. INN-245 TaxID=2690967 RepID=UPI0013118B14|nr:FlaD/FlaE family flagellar protein [Natrialba sp. INN-245]MWV41955.1 flagella accessory C family protein [Natrialba sp. INN-245]
MLLSIIGNILGNEDDDGSTDSGNGDDPLADGNLAGGMSEEALMPGTSTGGGESATDGGSGSMGGGMDDTDLFDDGSGSDDNLLGDDGSGSDGDLLGGGDEMGGEAEFEMDDGGDATFDGMDEDTGGVSSEIEARVEEMENEVGSLSSTVNTVQSENEQIGESLEEIEENIRKLLEVYEMVTQGVNPFVEGDSLSDTFDGGAQGSGNFGGQSLFDGQDDGDDQEDVDEDIANAEAEAFLDESLIDDEDDEEFADPDEGDEFSDLDEDDEFADLEADDDFETDDDLEADDETDDDGGDLSFDELKSQYDSGDADWEDEEDVGADSADSGSELDAESDSELDEPDDPFDDVQADDESEDPLAADDSLAEPDADGDDLETDDAGFEADDPLPADAGGAAVDDADASEEPSLPDPPWDDGGRPYLESIPSAYDTEFVVMDWLDYLVDEVGLNGAARTIRFYGSIRWIDPSVESYLLTTLNGFEDGPDVDDPEPSSALGVDHKRSLWWINRIATPEKKRVPFDQWLVEEGVTDDRPDDLEPSTTGDTVEDANSTVTEESDSFAPTDSPAEMEVSFTEEAIDPPSPDADGHSSETAVDAKTDRDVTSLEVSTDDSVDDEDRGASAGSACKIHIDESESTGRSDSVGDADRSVVEADEPDRPVVADRDAPERDQRMIWVDSDVILSESGIELREPRPDHDEDTARSVLEPGAQSEVREVERGDRESVKPVVERGGDSELERWQVELITSLFSGADEGPRR